MVDLLDIIIAPKLSRGCAPTSCLTEARFDEDKMIVRAREMRQEVFKHDGFLLIWF